MNVRSSITISMILSVLCSVTSAEQLPGVNKELADNAALVYWQAFSLMPKLDESESASLKDVLAGKKPDAQISQTLRQGNQFGPQHRLAAGQHDVFQTVPIHSIYDRVHRHVLADRPAGRVRRVTEPAPQVTATGAHKNARGPR